MPTSYSIHHKKYYEKRRDALITNSRTYYQQNKATILAKKKQRYAERKAIVPLTIHTTAETIQPA